MKHLTLNLVISRNDTFSQLPPSGFLNEGPQDPCQNERTVQGQLQVKFIPEVVSRQGHYQLAAGPNQLQNSHRCVGEGGQGTLSKKHEATDVSSY